MIGKISFSAQQMKRQRLQKDCDRQEHSQYLLTLNPKRLLPRHTFLLCPVVHCVYESEQKKCVHAADKGRGKKEVG